MPESATPYRSRRITSLWFDDGDIVIEACRSKGDVLCFKLYRDVLAVHAPVFLESLDDLLACEKREVDGMPVVFVPDDGRDMDWFLRALHHPSSLLRGKYKPGTFKNTLPLYKLASKYKVHYITDTLSAQLEQDWPKTIWEWDAYESDHALYMRAGRSNYADMNPEPVAAIRFAREANMPSILPAAFYQLSTISTAFDFDTQTRKSPSLLSDHRCARWSELSKEDLACLQAGRDRLHACMRKIRLHLAYEIPEGEIKCRQVWNLMPSLESNDVLRDLQALCQPDKLPGAYMCSSCRDKVNARARREREAIWAFLPEYFRLPQVC